MGVMMGTSHHSRWPATIRSMPATARAGALWNYATNKENLDRFFREGIERMKGTDDIVTIGMRGDGDEAKRATAPTRNCWRASSATSGDYRGGHRSSGKGDPTIGPV